MSFTDSYFPQSVRNDGEEDEDDDEDNSDVSSESEDPLASSRALDVPSIFNELNSLFPNLFVTKENRSLWFDKFIGDTQEGQPVASTSKPFLKIDPNLSGSWLDPPVSTPDTVGVWSQDVKLPISANSALPPLAPYSLPNRFKEFVITDHELKLLMDAKKFSKLEFEPAVFDHHVKNVSTNPLASLDSQLRASLMDGFISEALLQSMFLLIGLMENEQDIKKVHEQLALLKKVLHLTASSQFRHQQINLAAFVTNKSALRQEVLKEFVVPSYSQSVLKGSTFKGHHLFGPFPESFKTACLSSSAYQYRCKSRRSVTASRTFSAPSLAPPSKRGRPSYSPTSAYNSANAFRTSSSSSQDRQSQNFQRGKSKGKGKGKNIKSG